jgi:DNA-binding transcriptional MerR regulator
MKLHLDELDKYIRTNKITVYDIYAEGKKSPVYSSSDEQTVDETVERALETFNTMPSGVYLFKGKKSLSSSNNSWQGMDIIVGNYNETNVSKGNNSNNNRMVTYSQEDLDRHIKHATELKDKEFELKECKRMFEELSGKYKNLEASHIELSNDFYELLEILKLEGIKGKGVMPKAITDGITTVLEHGTKKVVDHFAMMEK